MALEGSSAYRKPSPSTHMFRLASRVVVCVKITVITRNYNVPFLTRAHSALQLLTALTSNNIINYGLRIDPNLVRDQGSCPCQHRADFHSPSRSLAQEASLEAAFHQPVKSR